MTMYCNQCGAPNPDGSRFCSTCGASIEVPQAAEQNGPQCVYTVEIFRESQLFLVNPPINLMLKGLDVEKTLSIANGQTVQLALAPGAYQLTFSLSIRSRTVEINLDRNIHIHLRWNRITGGIEAAVT